MSSPLRFLSGVPLMVMAAALLVLGLQKVAPPTSSAPTQAFGALLTEDGQYGEAVSWYGALATGNDPAALRTLANAADLAGMPGTRASALQRLVKSGKATLPEHIEAAQLLAWAGALPDALTVLFNAEHRFPGDVDLPFLSFYAALARDCRRPDIAITLAQKMWKRTNDDGVLRVLIDLSGNDK